MPHERPGSHHPKKPFSANNSSNSSRKLSNDTNVLSPHVLSPSPNTLSISLSNMPSITSPMPPPPKVNVGPIPPPSNYYQGGNSQKPGTSEVLVIHGDEGGDKQRARTVGLLLVLLC